MHHHAAFMAATKEAPGWASDFRELVGGLDTELHDVTDTGRLAEVHDPESRATSQDLGAMLRAANSNGVHYRSVRFPEGLAVALFWPDVAGIPVQASIFCTIGMVAKPRRSET